MSVGGSGFRFDGHGSFSVSDNEVHFLQIRRAFDREFTEKYHPGVI
jgi:hypothetical protein